ncbi:hypothetical protein BDY21DRAFT_353853 [Lineolata rhizophorae]|uniref:Uncharacterized protein n=1 Tax=Lineolata rhizophorae TaxID=578093 RepID=A0A6A6NR33_9PEZI|nr:hypothetical protein BDY21DRAFT_353853 [Lineolata rhizophorae]
MPRCPPSNSHSVSCRRHVLGGESEGPCLPSRSTRAAFGDGDLRPLLLVRRALTRTQLSHARVRRISSVGFCLAFHSAFAKETSVRGPEIAVSHLRDHAGQPLFRSQVSIPAFANLAPIPASIISSSAAESRPLAPRTPCFAHSSFQLVKNAGRLIAYRNCNRRA